MASALNGSISFLLKRYGNIIQIENELYDYVPSKAYPHGSIAFDILLDPVTYKRY